jgi:RNA polymerase sigma factor (sigma-70 family)
VGDQEGAKAGIAECLTRFQQSDAPAVEDLCRELRPSVESFVRRRIPARIRRWIEADDIVQAVLFETIQQLPMLPVDAGVDELMRRVHRTAGCRVRDAVRNHRRLQGESVFRGRPERPELSASVGAVTAADRRRFLEELVARLPAKYAEVVRLCGFEEITCAEAARVLGLDPDTVRKRYEVARRALARRLSGRDDA